MRKRSNVLIAGLAAFVLVLSACATEGQDRPVTMARADWGSGHMQAAIYAQLIEELGYEVTDPALAELQPFSFYPALAAGQYDLWANGWFPNHDIFLEGENVTGQAVELPIEPVGYEVAKGGVEGWMVDKATADRLGITSMADVAANGGVFDSNGNGKADLIGCNAGWGCNTWINDVIADQNWDAAVEQVVGDYDDLVAGVIDRVNAGESVLFYAYTPNWTANSLVAGDNVVWVYEHGVNDIRAVANTDFLDDNPDIRRLLEVVAIPLSDIAAQNARMAAADEYSDADVEADAEAWIASNRDRVDSWLEIARG